LQHGAHAAGRADALPRARGAAQRRGPPPRPGPRRRGDRRPLFLHRGGAGRGAGSAARGDRSSGERRRQRPVARPGDPDRRRSLGGAGPAQGGQDPLPRPAGDVAQGADGQRPAAAAARRLPRAGRARSRSLDRRGQHRRRARARRPDPDRRRRRGARPGAMEAARARLAAVASPVRPPPVDDVRSALAAFLSWVDRRAVREPTLAAYVLAGTAGHGIDERRQALATVAPRVVARGLRGLADAVSWQLRRQLLEIAPAEVAAGLSEAAAESNEAWSMRELLADVAPAEVAASLDGLDDETAWALRAELFSRVPEAVLESLALLDVPRAWALRERWVEVRGGLARATATYARARALARSVAGLESPEAWKMRKAARDAAPVSALASLEGMTSEKAWLWRERAVGRAPKAVLGTIAGMDDARAWGLRASTALRCREALSSMIGLDHPTAWAIREDCLEIWPPSVIKSLGVLVSGSRGQALLERALAGFSDQISLLKQAAIIATGANLMRSVMAA